MSREYLAKLGEVSNGIPRGTAKRAPIPSHPAPPPLCVCSPTLCRWRPTQAAVSRWWRQQYSEEIRALLEVLYCCLHHDSHHRRQLSRPAETTTATRNATNSDANNYLALCRLRRPTPAATISTSSRSSNQRTKPSKLQNHHAPPRPNSILPKHTAAKQLLCFTSR